MHALKFKIMDGRLGPPGPATVLASMFMEAEVGMLIVETIAKIRRAYFVQGKHAL